MSRPFRFVLPAVLLAGALGLSGCVGTIYDNTYSNRKTHFKPDSENKKDASAESILGALDKRAPANGADAALGGPPPAGEVPGLPPAGLPDAGGLPAPAAPAPAAPPPNN